MSSSPAMSTNRVPGQPGVGRETLSQKQSVGEIRRQEAALRMDIQCSIPRGMVEEPSSSLASIRYLSCTWEGRLQNSEWSDHLSMKCLNDFNHNTGLI